MQSLKNWWYKDEIESVKKKAIEVYNNHKTDYEKYDSKEAFEKEMDKIVNESYSNEMNAETVNIIKIY